MFPIKEQRSSNSNESDNESDHESVNEDEIENILSPPYLPYSPPHLDPNDITYTPIGAGAVQTSKRVYKVVIGL